MGCFDVFALPSRTTPRWKEQFGRVIIEAMACGVPVVGSDSGEIPRLIETTNGGLVFREGDAGDLAARLLALLEDPTRRRQTGEAGRQSVTDRYSYEAVAAPCAPPPGRLRLSARRRAPSGGRSPMSDVIPRMSPAVAAPPVEGADLKQSNMAILSPPHAPMPAEDSRTGRWSAEAGLWALMAVYALVYLLFFPRMYTSLDEAANFGMAYVLRHGTVFPAQVGYDLPMSPIGPHGPVCRFPIGFPAILALASFAGQWALFLVNPALHLVATWLFAKVLRAAGIPAGYAALYLLYPGFVLYERTLFSDPFAASLVTISLYCFLRPRGLVWAGACLGLALTARSTGLVITVIFAAALLISEWYAHRGVAWKEGLWKGRMPLFLLGLLPFVAVNAVYNFFTTGSALHSTYSGDMLTLSNLAQLGPLYATSLLLIFPGMLLAPLFYRVRFWRAGLVATSTVFLIAGSYYETTYGNNRWETLISVTRQILPVMPLYLLAYCGVLSKLLAASPLMRTPQPRRLAYGGTVAVLLLALVGISAFHQKHLDVLMAVRGEVRRAVPAGSIIYGNKDIFKLHQPCGSGRPTVR